MATPTSGPPLVCAKAPSPLRAGCPAAPGQGAHHVMLNAFVANADLLGDFPIRHAFQAVHEEDAASPARHGPKCPSVDPPHIRSEERRVGKESVSACRSQWSPKHEKRKYV